MDKLTTGRIRPLHSVRLRVLGATLILALGGFALSGASLWAALKARHEAQALADTSRALGALSGATIDLSLERSASQVSIEVPGTVSPGLRQLIDTQRRKVDAGLEKVLDEATGVITSYEVEEFRRAIAALREKLGPIRQSFDRLSSVPLSERPADEIAALPRALKAMVVDFQSQRQLLRGPGYRLPTDVAMLESIRDEAWQVREFGGRERTYFAIAAATGAPIREARLEEMAMLALRASDAWLDITRLARHAGLPAAVRAAIGVLQAGYFTEYAGLRKSMLAEAGKRVPAYPLNFDEFFARSSAALGGAEDLAASASVAIKTYWDGQTADTLRTVVLDSLVGALLAAAGVASGLLTARAFRRLDTLRGRMHDLAAGDAAAPVPHADLGNEIGAMARAVLVFRETARERAALEAAAAGERAERERRQAAAERHTRDFTESLAGVMRGLSAAAGRMDAASGGMSEAAGRTGDLARSTTEGAASSARDLSTVSAATEELTASVREISTQVARAASVAQAMATRAGGAEQLMASLAIAAERVGDVARLIGDVASQTNLLALNATIEAARAGEAGRGFAVVASEVKLLAGRTASATEEIAAQIGSIQTATGEAVGAVRDMAAEVRHMEEMAAAIAAAVEQQGAGLREIAVNIATISHTTEVAVGDMGAAVAAAEEARAISREVRDAAVEVGRESDTLGAEVDDFLAAMREAADERRHYTRLPGHNVPVRLHLEGRGSVAGRLADISRGGLSLRADASPMLAKLASGMSVSVDLPGTIESVPLRVVRASGELVALVARQQPGVEEQMERAIQAVGRAEAA